MPTLPSPLSAAMLPTTVATWIAFLPPAAAMWKRRSVRHDPAGWLGAGWLVMALIGVVPWVRFFVLGQSPRTPLSFIVNALYPLIFLPPTLTWIGGGAKRWQWPALAAWAVVWVASVVALSDARPFKAVMDPLVAACLGALSAVALAAQVRRAPSAIVRSDWFWILTGQVMYLAVATFREPLVETLVAHDWGAVIAVNDAIMLLFSTAYVVIARGMLLPPGAATPASPTSLRRVA